MRLLIPDTPITLSSTNVAASSLPEWSSSGVSYNIGDEVQRTVGQPLPHHAFRCLQAHTSALANAPVIDSNAYWSDLGAINQHAMFDGTNTARTVATDASGDIIVELTVTRRLQAVALLGLRNTATARILETVDGSTVADNTYNLMTMATPVGWWSYFFGERIYRRSLVHGLYGVASSRTLQLTLSGTSGEAEVAQALPCTAIELGPTAYGAAPRHKSFSGWEADAFGNTRFVKRINTRGGRYTVWVDTSDFDRIFQVVEDHKESLVLLDANNSGTSFDAVRAFGYLADVSTPGIQVGQTPIDFRIEGAS